MLERFQLLSRIVQGPALLFGLVEREQKGLEKPYMYHRISKDPMGNSNNKKEELSNNEIAYECLSPINEGKRGGIFSRRSKFAKSLNKSKHDASQKTFRLFSALGTIFKSSNKRIERSGSGDESSFQTTSMSGEEDSVFTSSTVSSTTSSQYTATIPPSPFAFRRRQRRPESLTVNTTDALIHKDRDPFARQSRTLKKTNLLSSIAGDDDIWTERLLINKTTGKVRSFFYSTNTGFRLRDEPPTGASTVIYLKQ